MTATTDWKRQQREKHHRKVQAAVDAHPEEALWWARWNYLTAQREAAKGKRGRKS